MTVGALPRARTIDHRSAGLDALRAFAAVLVVVFHMRTMLVVDFGPLNPVIEGGNTGVFVFFALSGYLLYRPFVRGDVDLRSYAIKRAARILPGYFVALAALAILTRSPLPVEHPLPYLTMTASYDIPLREFLGVAWTLAAEVLFYVFLPLIAWVVRGREILRLSMIGMVSVILGIYFRLVWTDDINWQLGAFPYVLYAFVPGMILAVAEIRRPDRFRRLAHPAVLVVGVVLVVLGCLQMGDPIAFPTGIGTALMMAWLLQHRVPGARPLAFIGGASYAMYLWHRDLLTAFGVFGVVIAAIGASLSWVIVERPILDRAHRIASRWRRAGAEPIEPLAVPSPASS